MVKGRGAIPDFFIVLTCRFYGLNVYKNFLGKFKKGIDKRNKRCYNK